MIALTLETARTVAIVATIVFAVLGIAAGILMKSIAQKLALVAICGLLAALVWTQRTSLDECADLVRTAIAGDQHASCTFFGQRITVTAASDT